METLTESAARICNGALAGAIGGAVASWAMNEYIAAQSNSAPRPASSRSRGHQRKQSRGTSQQGPEGGDDATVKVAQAISTRVLHRELTPREKQIAGPAVHYAYGSTVGALYGALAELWPLPSAGFGMLYGIVLWILGDEAAVPALRLGPPPHRVPASKHADYLTAHLVYGIALDVTRRVARHIV